MAPPPALLFHEDHRRRAEIRGGTGDCRVRSPEEGDGREEQRICGERCTGLCESVVPCGLNYAPAGCAAGWPAKALRKNTARSVNRSGWRARFRGRQSGLVDAKSLLLDEGRLRMGVSRHTVERGAIEDEALRTCPNMCGLILSRAKCRRQ